MAVDTTHNTKPLTHNTSSNTNKRPSSHTHLTWSPSNSSPAATPPPPVHSTRTNRQRGSPPSIGKYTSVARQCSSTGATKRVRHQMTPSWRTTMSWSPRTSWAWLMSSNREPSSRARVRAATIRVLSTQASTRAAGPLSPKLKHRNNIISSKFPGNKNAKTLILPLTG